MRTHRIAPLVAFVAALALGPFSAAAAPGDYTSTILLLRQSSTKPEATTESRSYALLSGGARWEPGPTVEYRILGAPFPAAVGAVEAAEATIDPYVTTRELVHNDGTTQVNPCTGEPNTVQWAPLDGPGGLLATTSLCVNKKKEIVGFVTTYDSLDQWTIGNDGNLATFDVQAVATHEFGHVAGLDHVTKPGDTCLTMYPNTDPEETQERTLGLGDKLGLDKLYGHGDTTPGPGCGL
jgi:hypothetical protein